jgi:hypothetical protein
MVFFFFGSFAPYFQNKLSTHASNLNSKFVIMSELEFFLLTTVLTLNFNTVDLVNFNTVDYYYKSSLPREES